MNVWLIISAIFVIGLTYTLKVIPERANVTYINSKYLEDARIYITRHGRKSPYYINIEGVNKQTWNNNVTITLIFYEYLHNEYRRSFVEMHFKLCDMLNSDPYIGVMIKKMGITCPTCPNVYLLLNMTVPSEDFPNVWPFQKGRVDGEFTQTETKESILRGYIYLSFV